MKKNLLCFSILFLMLVGKTIAQIPNGDFTNWSLDSIGSMDPDGWTSTNLQDSGTVLQDVDRSGGPGYSAKFKVVYDSTQGFYETGSVGLVHHPFSGSVRPTKLNGYWKILNTHSNDQVFVEVKFYNSSNVQIGGGNTGTALSANIVNWTAFSDSLSYTSGNAIDNYSITLFYFALSHDTALYCNLDDLSFDVNTGINQNLQREINCSIRKFSDGYNLDINKMVQGKLKINIVDINGRNVLNIYDAECSAGNHSLDFNLNTLSSGLYFCIVETDDLTKIFRLYKQ